MLNPITTITTAITGVITARDDRKQLAGRAPHEAATRAGWPPTALLASRRAAPAADQRVSRQQLPPLTGRRNPAMFNHTHLHRRRQHAASDRIADRPRPTGRSRLSVTADRRRRDPRAGAAARRPARRILGGAGQPLPPASPRRARVGRAAARPARAASDRVHAPAGSPAVCLERPVADHRAIVVHLRAPRRLTARHSPAREHEQRRRSSAACAPGSRAPTTQPSREEEGRKPRFTNDPLAAHS